MHNLFVIWIFAVAVAFPSQTNCNPMEDIANLEKSTGGRIRRLPQDVVNRIAAGEVVLRPSAAVKELLENSLDAGARNINVFAKSGGMKMLRITDDGCGISAEDLPLLCQRFATSKLRKFDDLRTVSTFGFRGEALASVSHVSRVSIVTKPEDARIGYSASYTDGKVKSEPNPVAASNGTTLTVEDLFYNLPTRRNALRATGEEYRAIVDVVARYAIRFPETSFVCRRQGDKLTATSRPDVRTRCGSTSVSNIRAAFGSHVSQELVPVSSRIEDKGVTVDSLVTKSSFNLKKRIFVLFINGRLVECSPLKRAIDSAYSEFLPKGTHPFAYVNITMRQEDIDVNVHPTKKEVRFLHETEIIDEYIKQLSVELRKSETSRTFLAQSVLTSGAHDSVVPATFTKGQKLTCEVPESEEEPEENDVEIGPDKPYIKSRFLDLEAGVGNSDSRKRSGFSGGTSGPHKRPRTSNSGAHPGTPTESSAPKFQERTGLSRNVGNLDSFLTIGGQSPAVGLAKWRKRRPNALPLLTSIRNVIEDMRNGCDERMLEIFKEHTFVGVASNDYVLLQHRISLYLVEIAPVVRDLMLRQVLMRFADLDPIDFRPSVFLSVLLGADSNPDAMKWAEVLFEKKDMLKEYFAIELDGKTAESVKLKTMPLLFQGVMPDMSQVCGFFQALATEIDWSQEQACLLGIASEIADLYGYFWVPMDSAGSGSTATDECNIRETTKVDRRKWLLHHVLFASLRSDYDPPKSFRTNAVVREITNTAKLYKVFERC